MTEQEIVDWLANAPASLTSRIVFNLGAGADLPQNVAPIQFAIAFVQLARATSKVDALRSEILKFRGGRRQDAVSQSLATTTTSSQLIPARNRQKDSGVDVFLSHSSEDKETVVRPLSHALENAGIRCWFDEDQIRWGDSISRRINDGLVVAKFVVVVISESFLQKEWPLTELSSAFNREMTERRTHVLPLFVCSRDQAIQRFPLFRDKLSLTWDGNTSSIVAALSSLLVDLLPVVSSTPEVVSGVSLHIPSLRKGFSDLDRKDFLRQSFATIRRFFASGLNQLEQSDSRIQTDIHDETNWDFDCTISIEGAITTKCRIWFGEGIGGRNWSIYYYSNRGISREATAYNEELSADQGDSQLTLKGSLGSTFGESIENCSADEAAAVLWRRYVRILES